MNTTRIPMRVPISAAAVAAALAAIGCALASPSPHELEGTYRVTWSEPELVAAGTSRRYAATNHGVITLWLDGGRYTLLLRSSETPNGIACTGGYEASATRVTIDLDGRYCRGLLVARWTAGADALSLRVVVATDRGDEALFGGKTWRRIDEPFRMVHGQSRSS
jgi:hypothetical protein